MFKSVQWKLAAMFLLVVLAVIIVIGTFTVNSIATFYNNDFINQIETAMTDDFTDRMTAALYEEQPEQAVFQTAEVFSARLGINSYRSFYVLDDLGNSLSGGQVLKTENIITAIKGEIGRVTRGGLGYMDYAYPIKDDDGNVKYILYIRDTKEEVYEVTRSIFSIILQALVMGTVLACVLGILLAKTITTPISNLTAKAEKIAKGDFEHIGQTSSDDEIGKLTNTFSYMSGTLKTTLEEIESERDKVETVIQCMTDGVMAFNQEGKVIHINPAAKAMLEIDDASQINFNKFFADLGADVTLGRFLYLDMHSTVEKTVDVGGRVLTAFITPFRSEKDRTGGVVAVWQDVTKRQKLEEVRREFVANVSHELKTPLTTIKSYTETLIDDNLENRELGLKFLGVVNNEVDRMTRIVTDLLLLSRIDYSQTEWRKEPFSIDGLVRETVEKFRSFIDPDAPELSAHGNLPDKIRAYCKNTNQEVPETIGQLVRCIYESLAMKYRLALEQIGKCTGKKFDVLHLMGGGTKDGFLCELAAQSLGIPVIAGPIEATALGNIVLQLIALGEIESIEKGREIIAENEKVKTFNEEHTPDWDEAFKRFCEVIKK